jgi:hypothetical protein
MKYLTLIAALFLGGCVAAPVHQPVPVVYQQVSYQPMPSAECALNIIVAQPQYYYPAPFIFWRADIGWYGHYHRRR